MADRLAQLEEFYSAMAAYRADPRNVTWRPVLIAFNQVGKPDVEEVLEQLSDGSDVEWTD